MSPSEGSEVMLLSPDAVAWWNGNEDGPMFSEPECMHCGRTGIPMIEQGDGAPWYLCRQCEGRMAKRREAQLAPSPHHVEHALRRILRLDYIPTWLNTPNQSLNGDTPKACIERGEIDRVLALIRPLMDMGAA